MKINEEDIRIHYGYLSHKEESEFRFINPKEKPEIVHYENIEDLIKDLDKFIDYNVYIGVNERKKGGTKIKDIQFINNFILDIDSKIKKFKTKEERENNFVEIQEVALKIKEDFEEKGNKEPLLICSGNGFHLYFALEPIPNNEVNREKIKIFGKAIKTDYENDLVKIDEAVFEPARVMRLAGTPNIKNPDNVILCSIINKDCERIEDAELTKEILSIKPQENFIEVIKDGVKLEGGLLELIEKDEKIKKLFGGDITNFQSRSEGEASLVFRLVGLNLDKDQIFKIMASSKIGKWNEENVGYRNLTYQKAVERVDKMKKEQNENKYSVLDNPEIEYQNLNQGIFNNEWYFGKLILEEKTNAQLKGLVFSDKELIHDKTEYQTEKNKIRIKIIDEVRKIGIKFNHELETNKNFWENKSMKKWLLTKEKINTQDFYKKIFDKINFYMDVKNENIIHLTTCWVIGTYFYELFETYGYLYFRALKDSGKSKYKKILRLIGFNGQEASSITEASFFRTIENTKGVLCIDEYERMDMERKKLTDLLLNAGIEKGAIVKRCEGHSHKNKDFDVYCPKIICNITGLNPTTQSRCITIKLFRSKSPKTRKKPSASDKEFKQIRNSCYIFALENWNEIKEIYDNYNAENLFNRSEDIWKPILTIGKFFDKENQKNNVTEENQKGEVIEENQEDEATEDLTDEEGIEKKLIELSNILTKENQEDEATEDLTYEILIKILDNMKQDDEKEYETNWVVKLFSKDRFGEKNPEKVIGWRLSSLNLFDKFKDGKKRGYKLSPKKIVQALYTRDYPIPKEYKKYQDKL